MSDRYIAGLNGLRALCVITVFLHHTGLAHVHGGGVGVDVFFVLSGYLITGILVREHEHAGRIDFRQFYIRRTRRLLPALLAMLCVVGAYVCIAAPQLDARMEVVPALLYVMNWVRAFGGYDAVLTGHTWSLAVEEQYYLVWPLLLTALIAAPRGRQRAVIALAVAIVLAAAWRWHVATKAGLSGADGRIVYGFDTHADGLLMGGLLALMPRPALRVVSYGWPLAAVYLIWVVFTPAGIAVALRVLGYTATAAAAATLIAKVVCDQDGWLVRALEWRPLAALGVVSYGFYLWHYPVVQTVLYGGIDAFGAFFGQLSYPRVAMVASTFGLSLGLTVASWFIVERRWLRRRHGPADREKREHEPRHPDSPGAAATVD